LVPLVETYIGSLPRIDSIETLEVCVPRRAHNRITTAYATLPDAHHALVEVQAGGLTGIGEAPTERWWTGEDAGSVRNAIRRYLAPVLVGEVLGIRAAVQRMNAALAQNAYAKAGVEMALWDLLGKATGMPLHVLLGGGPARGTAIKYVIGVTDASRAREEALHATESGFRYLKLKVGGELSADLERVAAVVQVLQSGQQLGVDANAGWSFVTALAALEPLGELNVAFLEQPVSPRFPTAMAELTSRSSIPIVAHESLFTARDAFEAATGRWAHVWALTPSAHGGVLPTLDLLALARAAGIPCLLGSTLELGIATALLAQLGAASEVIAECPIPSDVIGPLYHEDDVVVEPPLIKDGFIYASDRPGLGVELDVERVAAYRVNDGRGTE
jgi:L-alanine-DL-glutamate epimerase-like enolase superfamily enzyme